MGFIFISSYVLIEPIKNWLIFNFSLNSKKQNPTCCHPIGRITEEFTNYLEKTGVIAKVTDVLKMLYEMNEKPVDPLEYL